MTALSLVIDRSLSIAPGKKVITGYVDVRQIELGCKDRMAIGDVAAAYQKRLQLGENQPWPCPHGYWSDMRFVIVDGRHEFIAALMLGQTHILVAWEEA